MLSSSDDTPSRGEAVATLFAVAAASVSPVLLAVGDGNHAAVSRLGVYALPAAAAALGMLFLLALLSIWRRLARGMVTALWVGVTATAGLEVVRVIAFRVFGAMPGSMPMLIGVLLTNHAAMGPSRLSNLVGWADHFFNGFCFALIYILVLGRRRWWVGVLYAWAIGTIFMITPFVRTIGAGSFGQQFAPVGFPVAVYVAHTVYGALLGWLVTRSWAAETSLLECFRGSPGGDGARFGNR